MDIFASTISCGLTNLPVPPAAAAPAEVHKEASEEGRKEKRKAIESKVTASSCVLCVLCVSSVCEDLFPSWNVDDRRASVVPPPPPLTIRVLVCRVSLKLKLGANFSLSSSPRGPYFWPVVGVPGITERERDRRGLCGVHL